MTRFEWKWPSRAVVFYMCLSGKTSVVWWQPSDQCSLCAWPQNHSHECYKAALQEDRVSGCVCVQLFQKDICLNLCGWIEKGFFVFSSFWALVCVERQMMKKIYPTFCHDFTDTARASAGLQNIAHCITSPGCDRGQIVCMYLGFMESIFCFMFLSD